MVIRSWDSNRSHVCSNMGGDKPVQKRCMYLAKKSNSLEYWVENHTILCKTSTRSSWVNIGNQPGGRGGREERGQRSYLNHQGEWKMSLREISDVWKHMPLLGFGLCESVVLKGRSFEDLSRSDGLYGCLKSPWCHQRVILFKWWQEVQLIQEVTQGTWTL